MHVLDLCEAIDFFEKLDPNENNLNTCIEIWEKEYPAKYGAIIEEFTTSTEFRKQTKQYIKMSDETIIKNAKKNFKKTLGELVNTIEKIYLETKYNGKTPKQELYNEYLTTREDFEEATKELQKTIKFIEKRRNHADWCNDPQKFENKTFMIKDKYWKIIHCLKKKYDFIKESP